MPLFSDRDMAATEEWRLFENGNWCGVQFSLNESQVGRHSLAIDLESPLLTSKSFNYA